MSDFKWDDHPLVEPSEKDSDGEFKWDNHPIVKQNREESGLEKFGHNVAGIASGIGTAIDFPFAPVRGAVNAAVDFVKDPDHHSISEIPAGFVRPLTEGPSSAPSYKEIAKKIGFSDKPTMLTPIEMQHPEFGPDMTDPTGEERTVEGPSPAGVAGFLGDMAGGAATGKIIGMAPGAAKAIKGYFAAAPEAKGEVGAARLAAASEVEADQAQAARAASEASATNKSSVSGGGLEIEQGGKLFDFKAPKNLKELENWTPSFSTGELPGKKRLAEIEQIVPDLETKPLNYHYMMMENPKAMKDLKIQFENLPTDSANKISAYNQAIVDESADKINKTVKGIAEIEPRNLTDAGNDLISTVKDKYNGEKKALGPIFQELQKTPPLSPDESRDLALGIANDSKIGRLIKVNQDNGRIGLDSNTPRTGISDTEHGVLAKVVDDLNDGMSFKDLQNTREYLRKSINPQDPAASSEIANVRRIMLDHMEQMADNRGPDARSTFKAYAQNERARESVEKIIGGKIDNLDSMYAANPDRVVSKVLSNPNYAKVVGDYVGPDKMKELVQSWVQNGVSKSNDSAKGFDPSALRSWLKSNSTVLKANVDPDTVQRLNALADYGYFGKRFLDEANPSGTAASLKAMVDPQGFFQKAKQGGIYHAIESTVTGKVQAATEQRQAIREVNEAFGTPQPPTAAQAIKSGVKSSILNEGANTSAYGSTLKQIGAPKSQSAADNDERKKGPDKWANDGAKNLQKHDADFANKEMLDQLSKTKSGKDLLIKASDLKPGSKAMENLVEKIKSSSRTEDQ